MESNSQHPAVLDAARRASGEGLSGLGADHPETLIAAFLLARVRGEHDEAIDLYRQLMDTRERVFGTDHPETLTAVDTVANVLTQKGVPQALEPLYRMRII